MPQCPAGRKTQSTGVAEGGNPWLDPGRRFSPDAMSLRPSPKLTRISASPLDGVASEITRRLEAAGVRLTLGGEPTYVPLKPEGAEWNVAAVGPTKLGYAYKLADALVAEYLPGAITIYSPGKQYPGEVNPRWVVNVLANRDGSPLAPPAFAPTKPTAASLQIFQAGLAAACGLPKKSWLRAIDPADVRRPAAVLPLDHDGRRWRSRRWNIPGSRGTVPLVAAEGPVGLRLPLNLLPEDAMRRALTLELREGAVHLFLPPLMQAPFKALLDVMVKLLADQRVPYFFEGYVPPDEDGSWTRLGLTADPGVLEVNLPPCETWQQYHQWLTVLERTGRKVGLCSTKRLPGGDMGGTGGGNHLLFGGPTLEANPFFRRPGWVASLLRYFQAHPCLAYLFTGMYVGPSSQAPRPDESARDLYDLDLAYRHFDRLPEGDHRYVIGETLRHLHIDISGNTHRSEISFDKFWNLAGPASGAAGLIEFRAIESMPAAASMSAVALLWQGIALFTLEHPSPVGLTAHGSRLHDQFFLPSVLWSDLQIVLADLQGSGLDLPDAIFRAIWEWRFPRVLEAAFPAGKLEVRRACESWPLLCETPSEGGSTSRFVDTSIERLEITADPKLAGKCRLFVNGRELGLPVCGLRYRRTALYPSLHPGLLPHLPLELTVTDRRGRALPGNSYVLTADSRSFKRTHKPLHAIDLAHPAAKSQPEFVTYDLRL